MDGKRTLRILAAAGVALFTGCATTTPPEPGHVVEGPVDLDRYAGRWYEIAAFPQFFQKGCHCTVAEYRREGDRIRVVNRCRKGGPDGPETVARGWAEPVPDSGNARLTVSFFWPFSAPYWIVGLDREAYRYAMVGHPDRDYLWILSRTPELAPEIYRELVDLAREKGYPVERLRRTDQSCFVDPSGSGAGIDG